MEVFEGIEFDWREGEGDPFPVPRVRPLFEPPVSAKGEQTAAAKVKVLGAYERLKSRMPEPDAEHLESSAKAFMRLVWEVICEDFDEDQQREFLLAQRRWISEAQYLRDAFEAGKLSRKPGEHNTKH